jgi:hypothetical protein
VEDESSDIGGSGIGDWTEHEEGEKELSRRDECDSGLGVAEDRVEPVSGLSRPLHDVAESTFATVDKSGARMPESSESFASEGVGDCWARQARVRAWKSNL